MNRSFRISVSDRHKVVSFLVLNCFKQELVNFCQRNFFISSQNHEYVQNDILQNSDNRVWQNSSKRSDSGFCRTSPTCSCSVNSSPTFCSSSPRMKTSTSRCCISCPSQVCSVGWISFSWSFIYVHNQAINEDADILWPPPICNLYTSLCTNFPSCNWIGGN